MLRSNHKIQCLVIAAILSVSIFAGCASSKSETSPAGTTASKLKPVVLQVYMVGDAPTDLQLVEDKINALATKDINATVKFNYTTWTDYSTKYNLLLAAGQPIDLIYTANWLDYGKLAKKGAFKPLEGLLTTYGSDLKKFIPQSLWDQVKVDGKIYTMPSTSSEYISDGFQYRKDLQEKYNLPVPNTLQNVEAYLEGVKKNVPGQVLTNEFVNAGSFSAMEILTMKYKWVSSPSQFPYGLYADIDSPGDVKQYWGSADFTTDMKMFKRWADEGLWSRSALSNKADTTMFDNGQIVGVMAGQNANKYGDSVNTAQIAHPDWKIGYAGYPDSSGIATLNHATQNGFAIPNSSQNPERAMMFYQKLVLDKKYNLLTEYGIEGTHYTVKDGYYQSIGDPTKSGFPLEGMNGWAWRNPIFMLHPKSYDAVKTIYSGFDKVAAKETKFKGVNVYDGFFEDYSSYQSERAALATVCTQYLAPIEAGLVPNVDAAIKIFMEKAKAAGLDKIQTEYTKQWKAYCTEHNYN